MMNDCKIYFHFVIIIMPILWVISIILFWNCKSYFARNIENQSRIFILYVLISAILILIISGDIYISQDYLSNLIVEFIGIFITVLLIDRVYKYITDKNEKLYRGIAIRTLKMPIYTYCANWLFIFEKNTSERDIVLDRYSNLESFFTSDEFRERIKQFDFNKIIGEDKTYAKYYEERMSEIRDRFQLVLKKYASKLSHQDIVLLEYFGGGAYMYNIFALMKHMSDIKFTSTNSNNVTKVIIPFNNSFKDIKDDKFSKHFRKLNELIDEYNNVIENNNEKWTIRNINKLNTVSSAHNDPMTDW